MKIAILGFGREGQSIFKYLKKNPSLIPFYEKGPASTERGGKEGDLEIWILDTNSQIKIPRGVRAVLGKNYLDNLTDFAVIYRSPGIPYNLPQIQAAIKKGVKFGSATQLFLDKCPAKIIGVTGTKGKGTTSTLIYNILRVAQKDVYLVGNIEKPCLDILSRLNKNSLVVFELSSFQLWDLKKSPSMAVVLGIFPDHLDKHKNFKEYFEAKANIAKYQKEENKIFYVDEKYSRKIAEMSRGKKIAVARHSRATDLSFNLKIIGPHNLRNAIMAATVAKDLGVDEKIIKKAVENFRGLPYRLQFVGKINLPNRRVNGILFYNDSASTNPESTAIAIQSFEAPVILIAGGKDKGLNYALFAKALRKSKVKAIFLFGENKEKIKAQIKSAIPLELCLDLKSALEKSLKIAYDGDIIVFSPGSASFDMFKDYKDRGEVFNKLLWNHLAKK